MLNAWLLRDSFLTDSGDQWTWLFARPADTVPEHTACPGGCRYELKFDGFRVAVVRTANGARLWSRRGTELTFAFPDLAAAAEFHLRSGTVLDGRWCGSTAG